MAGPARTCTGFRRVSHRQPTGRTARSLCAVPARPILDRCPSALRPYTSKDGAIVRARVPGGEVALDALDRFLAVGERWGAPFVQLTTRANLQVRALPDPVPDEAVAAVMATGWFPSASHERARNILRDPLASHLQPVVDALDETLCATPELASLPGRFLFLVTDASGVALDQPWDLAWRRMADGSGQVLARGPQGVFCRPCAPERAPEVLTGLAARFLGIRVERQWNVRDLGPDSDFFSELTATTIAPAEPLRPGPVAGSDALIAGLPLGLLDRTALDALRAVTDQVTLTPWRSLLVPGGAAHTEALPAAGLSTAPAQVWSHLSACTGAPWCANGQADVMGLARESARLVQREGRALARNVHLVACERRCGAQDGELVLLSPTDVTDAVGVADALTEGHR